MSSFWCFMKGHFQTELHTNPHTRHGDWIPITSREAAVCGNILRWNSSTDAEADTLEHSVSSVGFTIHSEAVFSAAVHPPSRFSLHQGVCLRMFGVMPPSRLKTSDSEPLQPETIQARAHGDDTGSTSCWKSYSSKSIDFDPLWDCKREYRHWLAQCKS